MRAFLCFLMVLAIASAASAFLVGPTVGRQNVTVVELMGLDISCGNSAMMTESVAAKTTRANVDRQALLEDGKCEDFEQSPLMCQYALIGIWNSVWTAPSFGLTQEYWQAQMHGAAQSSDDIFVSYIDAISSLPYDGCAQAYARLICPSFFPPCVLNPDPTTNTAINVLPMPVCRSVCEAANDACRAYRGGADLVDCVNTISPLTGSVQWPEDSFECTSNSAVIFLKEQQEDQQEDQQEGHEETRREDTVDTDPYGLEFSCPTPLIFYPEIPDQYSGLACSTTCKQKMFVSSSPEQYKAFAIYMSVASWVSFVLVSILIFTILLFPTQRKFPTVVVLFAAIGLWFVHLASVGASFIGIDFNCKNKTELEYGFSYCGFYAWALFFGGLLAIIWWTYMGFIIFYNIALQRTRNSFDEKLFWPMCVFGWVYPIVASIVAALLPSPDDSGSFGVFAWCWVALKHSDTHLNMIWGLFFPWAFIGAILVPFFVLSAIGRLLYQGTKSSMSKRSIFQFALLMSIFCLYFFVTVVSVITGEMFFSRDTSLEAETLNWLTCIFSWRIATSDCPRPTVSNPGIFWWQGVSFSLCGTVMFVCFFVLRDRTWKCWAIAIDNLRAGRDFYDGITSSAYPTTGRETSGSRRSGTGSAVDLPNVVTNSTML